MAAGDQYKDSNGHLIVEVFNGTVGTGGETSPYVDIPENMVPAEVLVHVVLGLATDVILDRWDEEVQIGTTLRDARLRDANNAALAVMDAAQNVDNDFAYPWSGSGTAAARHSSSVGEMLPSRVRCHLVASGNTASNVIVALKLRPFPKAVVVG